MILGGVAAHMGYLSIGWVIICGFLGTVIGDQLYFFLGRRHGSRMLSRRPAWQARSERVFKIIQRHQSLLILGFRFLYGLRTVTPFAIGMRNIPYLRFAALNLIGAALWAVVVGLAGFYFGRGEEALLGEIKHYEVEVMVTVVTVGVLILGVFIYRSNAAERRRLG